jgi:NTP pyrophosphatase (non-canonical NTP hydrolase)
MEFERLQDRLRQFASARDWDQFHSPKNLAMATAGEVGELVEIFQWLTEEQSRNLSPEDRARVAEELADVQIYLVRLADQLGIDLDLAVESKIEQNERKYPVAEARGNATKSSRRK